MMKLTVESNPRYKFAYIRSKGSYGDSNVQTMKRLKEWASEKSLLNPDSIILGIAWDDPSNTKAADCRYDTGIVVADIFEICDKGIQTGEIEGGKYAIAEIDHTAEALQKVWANIFLELAENSYKLDCSRPIMERYRARMIASHKCEICIPIH